MKFVMMKKTNSGFVILPSRRRLRDYKNYIRPQQGFNKDVINKLKKKFLISQILNDILLMDEMKVQEKFGLGKHKSDLMAL